MKLSLCPPRFQARKAESTPAAFEKPQPRISSSADSDQGTLAVSGKPSGASTPNQQDIVADSFVREVLGIYNRLKDLTSLAPCPVVNESLSRLVAMSCQILPATTVEKVCEIRGHECLHTLHANPRTRSLPSALSPRSFHSSTLSAAPPNAALKLTGPPRLTLSLAA